MGGFRPDLDITEYQRRVGMVAAPAIEESLPESPVKRGWGPAAFSTCTDIAVIWAVWDVNGYYTVLGFRFPYRPITRRDLRLGYYDHLDDDYATYAFKLLINPHFRAAYDAMEMGDPIIDQRLSEMIKRSAAMVARGRRIQGDQDADQDSVMGEWGLHAPADLGDVPSAEEITSQNPEVSGSDEKVWTWSWGYYLWRSRSRDIDRLHRWQDLLVAAFAASGIRRQIAVGFMGRTPHRASHAVVAEQLVLFLHEDVEPTEDLAAYLVASSTTTGEVATKEIEQHGVA